ncbi:uncharacterized protein LOC130955151 [Arachis stenosperma]|uniref:uncharacterized protein LOC130955151 n=1 Tax=Arachis stenosperma TaxID=217475 RepID=UPI0025AC041B|nr:uncharacterized protein LOC130955151 [Arachis stenosperma]XP_057737937.1 uncharacterized protein LOC130955151 [Arachis stenosperma]XP_057737938.1 uncharacterized protein LOC130955151 [Arachis stenosperma]XP_057737939.1 uncharacterized protein LOC130955151 [Arachis stenosperma]XP_057737940.1 uncharacterized protein LOC130955151 [Arachis stenosperma]XP_057737941.1 uncharacterized protein LOC130955151 [Arachis stenosperma]
MDLVINAAVEEICGHLEDGITLAALWDKLEGSPSLLSSGLQLSPAIKRDIWTNLLNIPTLRFEPQPTSSELEDANELNLKIIAQKSLVDNFMGLYDSPSLQQAQMRVLHLLASVKANGITQSNLAKQLNIDGNNFHYVLRSLECQGLVVKHPAIEKKKQISTHGDSKNYPCVSTHLVYLRRYAKKLESNQRFELQITKSNNPEDDDEDAEGNSLQTDVLLKDYAPQMKAICDKLAKANGKVLLASEIKKELGYFGSRPKQRIWRTLCRRLKADNVAELFDAKVNGKVESCLRLVEPVTTGSANEDKNSNFGKVCVIDQFVELPIEHQIFDMIDAAGSSGITFKEVCERLGIDLKKNHIRLINFCHRFGMKVQQVQDSKSKTIRVWTSKNFNCEPEAGLFHKLEENKIFDHVPDSSSKSASEFDTSTSHGRLPDPAEFKDIEQGAGVSCESPRNVESEGIPTNLQEVDLDPVGTVSNTKRDLVSLSTDADVASSAMQYSVSKNGLNKRYTSYSFTVDSNRRANRILERLKNERFILRSEMSRWLTSLEKSKYKSQVDRKTIDRILNKLQEHGLCKCITVHSPVVTEYSKTKDCIVVVHPSINLTPELFDAIQDRVRSFDMELRSKSMSHKKDDESIPVMEDIQKTKSHVAPDSGASKADVMRANGFVLAKMIRAKLLHTFLWDYLHGSASHDDPLSNEKCIYELNNNPHSSSKLFSLETVIKAIPVELFLQVVGSTQKFEEMIEKCKMGIRLSDISTRDYNCLMDTNATGRLSKVIDILRRLKLIRIVADMQSRDEVNMAHTFSHMLELKPYIEEPLSSEATSLNFMSHDLRPRIRHDFVLSNRDAVDEYWQTLEYCYAAADPKAATYAFPGCVVHEVFRFRSWASTRLMTAEQRDALLKHVAKDDLGERISYRDCEKIAKDLNLTLEQVLSVYSIKRRHYIKKFKDERKENSSLEGMGRKYSSTELRPEKHARIEEAADIEMHMEEDNLGIDSGEHVNDTQEFEDDVHSEEGSQDCPLISQCVLSTMKPRRQRRFAWSDKADRQLVIQYVRHRAALGAKYHRMDWTSVPDLPAPPRVCMRRMNLLNSNERVRKAVNRLCNILGERYAEQLEMSQNLSSKKDDCRELVRSQSSKGVDNNFRPDIGIQMPSLNGEPWDDFENKTIKNALEDILRYKMMAKLDASSKKVQPQYEGLSDANADADGYESQENEDTVSAIPSEITQSHHGKSQISSAQRSRRRLDKNFKRFLSNTTNVYGQVYKSLAISNAVELFKLVFLSTSSSPQAPSLLADILRRYSEHDLFAAFNYLREKKIMVGGNGRERFELSQQFLQCVSKSPFPFNTAKRAVKFSLWLQERDKVLKEMGTNLAEDLQCGDIFQLFALVSSGELSISPCLPDNGVGEAEDLRNTKRKSDVEGEIISRREKGFPGIVISVHCTTMSRADILDLLEDNNNDNQPFEKSSKLNTDENCNNSGPDQMLEVFNSCDTVPVEENHIESPWEAMVGYAKRLMFDPSNQEQECVICAEVFRVVYAAIQNAGDQGLSMGEISQIINLPGAEVDGLLVDVLQAFGQAFKVNAFDSVRVVDALYRHKYFLTPVCGLNQGTVHPSSPKTIEKSGHTRNLHKVTILNLPLGDEKPKSKACDRNEGFVEDRLIDSSVDNVKDTQKFSSGELCVPILPWINGDGTINSIVYNGLRRRILGIVMQNPGMLEGDILRQMHALNPQSCRTLLELMVLDKHLIVRKMHQERFGPPSILQNLIGRKSNQSKWICLEHYFANPMSTSFL